MKKIIITALASALMFSGVTAFAETSTTSVSTTSMSQLAQLIITLKPGMTHEQVKLLQVLLASDSTVYPEGTVSGFFGNKTRNAVKRFQRNHGISQTGFVGPMTRSELNKMLSASSTAIAQEHEDNDATSTDNGEHGAGGRHNSHFCFTQAIGHTVSPGWMKHHGGEMGDKKGKGHQEEKGDKHDNDDNEDLVLPRCKHDGDHGTTTPPVVITDTTAPVISSVSAASITTSSASIVWSTNEGATSKVFFGTTSPVSTSTAGWTDMTLQTSHSAPLTSLVANTTYYYVIMSTDAANNSSVSAQGSFMTNAVADVTAPTISALTATVTGSTTATIAWTTNEAATSKAYYGTTSPVTTASIWNVVNAALVTAHTSMLTGLSASTTYYTIVESRDAANNVSTSSQISFTTTQ